MAHLSPRQVRVHGVQWRGSLMALCPLLRPICMQWHLAFNMDVKVSGRAVALSRATVVAPAL